MKTNQILLLLVLISPLLMKGQQNLKQIRISEENLTALVEKIVAARQNQLLQNKRSADVSRAISKNQGQDLRAKLQTQQLQQLEERFKDLQQQKFTNPPSTGQNNDKRSNELLALENEIDLLKMAILRNSNKSTNDPVIIYPNANTSPEVSVPKNTGKDRTASLEKQLDSLGILLLKQSEKPSETTGIDYSEDMDDLRKMISSLKEDINSKQTDNQVVDERLSNLKYFKKTIYFDNNSKQIKPNYTSDLKDILNTLETYSNVDILVNGFASKKGNPIYNENLSMQRTEAIKQWLIAQSIHPIRILTSYHGIDYTQTSEAEARRVEIKYIIRN